MVIAFGIPKDEIQPWLNASTIVSAVMSRIGIAVAHLVKRSATVSKYENPFDVGIDTMSACMCENLLFGTSNSPIFGTTWRVTFAL